MTVGGPASGHTLPGGPTRSEGGSGAAWSGEAVLAALVALVGVFAITFQLVEPKATWDWWYDEMWRLDLLRRVDWRDAYIAEATPVAPLWFALLRAALRLGSDAESPAAVRAFGGVLLASAPAAVAGLAVGVVGDRLRPIHAAAAGIAVALLVFGGRFSGEIFSYLNGYGFESGVSLAALASCCSATRDRPLPWHLALTIILIPAAAIGGVLLLPGIVLTTAYRVLRANTGRPRWVLHLAGTCVASALVALISYLTMYRAPLGRESTAAFFVGDRFSGALGEVGPTARDLLVDSLRWAGFAPLVLTLLLTAAGVVLLLRREPVVVITLIASVASLLLVSQVTGFPASAHRVNAPIVLLVASVPALAVLEVVLFVTGRVRLRGMAPAGIAAMALLGVVLWRPQTDEPPYKPLRGLTQDLHPLTVAPYRSNVILAYHWYTKWWLHDLLVNRRAGGDREYHILAEEHFGGSPEAQIDQPVYQNVRSLVEEHADPSTAVWCILPFETGPEAFDAACNLTGTGRARIELPKGTRARIILWVPAEEG